MRRFRLAATLAAAMAAAALALAPTAAASAAASAGTSGEPAASVIGDVSTGVDDFTFDSFDAVYELSRDEGGHSVLDTTETIVARFPEIDQNRGIRRAIPSSYRGHPTDIEQITVTDETGTPRAFEVDTDDDDETFVYVTVRADDYVHGEQTYVIGYRQHNVTLQPDDAAIDEFYWDVNGTGWAQPFGRVSAELRLSDDVAVAFTGDASCYQGGSGSSTTCDSLEITESQPPSITVEALDLGPYENLTLAAAFAQGTFVPRDESFGSSPAAITSAIAAAFAVLAAGAAAVIRGARWRDHPGRGTIIAEYEPPAGISPMVAADLVGRADKGVTATILDLAVGGELRIVESGKRKYAVERLSSNSAPLPADADAAAVMRALFAEYRRRRELTQDTALGKELLALRTSVGKRVVGDGLRRRASIGPRLLLAAGALVAAVLALVFGIIALDAQMGGFWPAACFIVAIIAAVVTFGTVAVVRPLTAQGRVVRDHLEGLRLYIRLAEADRLRVLQSPSGALRVERPAAASVPGASLTDASGDAGRAANLDPVTVLKLNERLLPYAVLFGLEREWSRELSALYEQTGAEPSWYAGRDGFNARLLAAGVSSFSSAASSSWSGSSSSSSSSGSGGGGSSGGGGGGGGGGGV